MYGDGYNPPAGSEIRTPERGPEFALQMYAKIQQLKLNPERYRAIAGAARAAERAGKTEAARDYYAKLLQLAKPGDGKRPEIAQAQAFVDRGAVPVAGR